jgi:hypothetical protein
MAYADQVDAQIAERCSPLAKHRVNPDTAIEEFNESIGLRAPVQVRAQRMRGLGSMGGESVPVRG